jgi:hypothetical protein
LVTARKELQPLALKVEAFFGSFINSEKYFKWGLGFNPITNVFQLSSYMKFYPKENGNRMSVFSIGRKAVEDNKIAKHIFDFRQHY